MNNFPLAEGYEKNLGFVYAAYPTDWEKCSNLQYPDNWKVHLPVKN